MSDLSLIVRNLKIRYKNNRDYTLDNITFELHKEELIIITGRNGSGKSTLLKAISRLFIKGQLGEATGEIKSYGDIAFCMQRPKSQLLSFRVDEEIASTLSFKKIMRQNRVDKVDDLLLKFNLAYLKNKDPRNLSAGEQQIVIILATLIDGKKIIVMDEPFALLDDENSQILLSFIEELLVSGHSIIIVDHDIMKYSHLNHKILKLSVDEHPVSPREEITFDNIIRVSDVFDQPYNTLFDCVVGYSTPLFRIGFNPVNGITLIRGKNGSGKTSILKTIADIIQPIEGENIDENYFYVPQDTMTFFWKKTVSEEYNGDLPEWMLTYAEKSPFSLSDGERKKIAIAIALKNANRIVLDEPSQSLDYSNVEWLVHQFKHFSEKEFIVASNDSRFIYRIRALVKQIIEVK